MSMFYLGLFFIKGDVKIILGGYKCLRVAYSYLLFLDIGNFNKSVVIFIIRKFLIFSEKILNMRKGKVEYRVKKLNISK